jgi:hypothetical protein
VYFDLERGNAQGDTSSPYIFNLGFQILLFKINYDFQISGVLDLPVVPPDIPPLSREVGTRPFKIWAYADDANTLIKLEHETLSKLKLVLNDFGTLSGLICNVEKTTLLQVGDVGPISQEILDLGFSVVDEVTVLGLTLSGVGADFSQSLQQIGVKLQSQVNHWARFNLSLPGRINVAKTMLYSQINYLGCFLPINNQLISQFENIIERFVCGKMSVSKARLYKPVCMGGLGLFRISDFLDAQRVSWVRRSQLIDDKWKINLYSLSYGSVFNIRKSNFNANECPCLSAIANSYEKFLVNFTKTKENFWSSYIYCNEALTLEVRSDRMFDNRAVPVNFFVENEHRLKGLKVSDFINRENRVLPMARVSELTQIPFDVFTFQTIVGLITAAKTKYKKNDESDKTSCEIRTFINRSKNGSSRFRKVLCKDSLDYIPHNIVKFSNNTETIIGLDNSKKLNLAWKNSYLNNSTRTFLFKLHNNTLGYNHAVAHFVRNHSPNCTFCDIEGNQEIERETPLHLFFGCEPIEALLNNFFRWFSNEPNFEFTRSEFFVGFNRNGFNTARNEILNIASHLVKKFIWDCKQRFCVPNIMYLKTHIKLELESISSVSRKFKAKMREGEFNNIFD